MTTAPAPSSALAKTSVKSSTTHRAYVWVYATTASTNIQSVVHDFSPSCSGESARNFLQGWKGQLVCNDCNFLNLDTRKNSLMLNFHYPFKNPDGTRFTDASELYQALNNETSGHYLMGSHMFWHGGVHITDKSAPQCVLDDALCCIADGEVVAYRLNDEYRESTFGEEGQKLKYSNSFCLVRHEYQSAPNPEEGANNGKRNTLTFYSLYMHLLPYNGYRLFEAVRPGYWHGKVRATARKCLPLYQAPLSPADGQLAGAKIGNRELCETSVIEFDSREVLTLTVGNQPRLMAKCTLISGGCRGPESVPPTFWTIVDSDAPKKLVEWGAVAPMGFNEVICTNVPIKAGDPVGYLGYIENLKSEHGEIQSNYQVRLELFATGTDVKGFLQNTAGLKIGMQFLHLSSATVLKKKAPVTASVRLRQKHVINLSTVPIVQDGGEDFYEVSVVEFGKPVSGLLKKTDADIITQHDWEKLGFQIVEESNALADGFVDPDHMPTFFRELFAKIDTSGNGTVEPDELKAALMNPATRDQWTRLVAYHPTEWKEKADSPKWGRLDKLFGTIPKTLKHEKERIDHFVFWDELSGRAQMASDLIYHFHPIAFVASMMCPLPIKGNARAATREAIIKKVQSQGHTFTERLAWGAAKGKPDMVEDWDYTMIALHHAGRSYECTPGGVKQMQDVQAHHMGNKFSDIGYHYGIACDGSVLEGRDIRLQASSVKRFNTGVISIVLLENLTTAQEGGDIVAKGRETLEYFGYNTTNVIPSKQIDALLHLVEVLKSVFVIERFGGHREFPGQGRDGKICPGNVGMELVRNIRAKTQLLPPPRAAE